MAELAGLSGIKRAGQKTEKQTPSKPGQYSAKTAADNASFDRSPYQDIVKKSMVGGK